MRPSFRYARWLVLSLPLSACSTDALREPDAAYRYALQYELDNRATAWAVVPRLAKRHRGSPRGEFWAAYAALERFNRERYAPVATHHGLSGGNWKTWVKIQGSLAAETVLPDRFVQALASATQDYLHERDAVPLPSAAPDRRFLQHIRVQEAAQATALALAAEQKFEEGGQVLRAFVQVQEAEKSAPERR